jgi:hypothetical protein
MSTAAAKTRRADVVRVMVRVAQGRVYKNQKLAKYLCSDKAK